MEGKSTVARLFEEEGEHDRELLVTSTKGRLGENLRQKGKTGGSGKGEV